MAVGDKEQLVLYVYRFTDVPYVPPSATILPAEPIPVLVELTAMMDPGHLIAGDTTLFGAGKQAGCLRHVCLAWFGALDSRDVIPRDTRSFQVSAWAGES